MSPHLNRVGETVLIRVTRYDFMEIYGKIIPKVHLLPLFIWSSDYNRSSFRPVRADPIFEEILPPGKQTGSKNISVFLFVEYVGCIHSH